MYVSISVYCSCICTVSSIIYASVTFARCDLDYLKFLARKLLLVLQHRIFVSCFFFFSFFRSLVFVSWSAEIHTRQINCCNFLSWKLVVCTSISSMLSMGLRMRKNYLIFLSVWESRHILCCRHMHTAAIEILALILVMSVGKHF